MSDPEIMGECAAGLRASGTGTMRDKRFERRNLVRCYDEMR